MALWKISLSHNIYQRQNSPLEMTGHAEYGACVQSILHTTSFTHVLRVFHWERPALWAQHSAKTHKQECASMRTIGTSGHRHTDISCTEVCQFLWLFLFLPKHGAYTRSTSPLSVRWLLPQCCQRSPAETKEAESEARAFLNQRKLVLITLPPKKHSDPVNPHAGCQLETKQQSTGRVKLAPPHPDRPLFSFLFLFCVFSSVVCHKIDALLSPSIQKSFSFSSDF